LIPAKKSSGLPGPSRSAMSPAKKRRAHSQDREVSGKRQRINEPLHQRAPAPSPAPSFLLPPLLHLLPPMLHLLPPLLHLLPPMLHLLPPMLHLLPPMLHLLPPMLHLLPPLLHLLPPLILPPLLLRDLEVVEYQGAVLSNQVPIESSLLMEEHLNNLWATARLVTKRDRQRPDPEQGSVRGGCRGTVPRISGCSPVSQIYTRYHDNIYHRSTQDIMITYTTSIQDIMITYTTDLYKIS
ncbi:hypothetical protein CDAR_247731, partial [Caerostris darwini]